MAFQLPHMEDLTTTQKSVLNAPLNKSIVVRGAPGTGKTEAVYQYTRDCLQKLKKAKVDVSGVLIDGVGYGTATIKKAGSVAVTIE